MTRVWTAALAAVAMLFGAAAPAAAENMTAGIIGVNGNGIGVVTLIESPGGVLLRIQIVPGGLPAGAHGMHLHSVGDCSDIGTFKRSKGHINEDGREHGLLNPNGPDNADLPNLVVREDGTADVELFTSRVRLVVGQPALLDSDGSALVIHANADDHMTQPIGGAGPRIACAEIKR